MFAALYRWRVKPGMEAQFIQAWHDGTVAIRRDLGGLGSRLHRAEDGTFVAYAEWPDRATWEKAFNAGMKYDDPDARARFVAAIEDHGELLYAMPMVDDLLPRGR